MPKQKQANAHVKLKNKFCVPCGAELRNIQRTPQF